MIPIPGPPSPSIPTPTARSAAASQSPALYNLDDLISWIRHTRRWEATLLQHVELLVPEEELEALIGDSDNITIHVFEIVSDGGHKDGKCTFGWVLAHKNKRLAKGGGNVPFESAVYSSFRAEGFGMTAGVVFLVVCHDFFGHSLPSRHHWKITCDNLGLIKKLRKFDDNTYRIADFIGTDSDIICCLRQQLHRLGNYSLHHVKGHQNKKGATLSPTALLNIHADAIATARYAHKSPTHLPLLPGTAAMLTINNEIITAKMPQRIRAAASTPKLRIHFQTTYGWRNAIPDMIAWKAHGDALSSMNNSGKLFVWKLIHGFLPVGKQAHRYDQNIAAACSYCGHPEEDILHMIHCSHPAKTEQWQLFHRTLRRHLLRQHTDPVLYRIVMHQFHKLTGEPSDAQPPVITSDYKRLVTEQQEIGWNHFLYGRWSQEFETMQQRYLNSQQHKIKNKFLSGHLWIKKTIIIIWTHLRMMWQNRCAHVHGETTQEQQELARTQLWPQVLQLYEHKHLLPLQDQELFLPLADLKRRRLTTIRNWISIIEPLMHNRIAHHTSSQTRMTDFFQMASRPT